MYSLIKIRLHKVFNRVKRATTVAKQISLMICVALRRHSTSTGSKHDAAVLTDSQHVFSIFDMFTI